MDHPNPKLFFQKNRLLSNMTSKNQVNRRNIFTEKKKKKHCFLKVLTTFFKVISKIISTIVIKNATSMKIIKMLHYVFTQKVKIF